MIWWHNLMSWEINQSYSLSLPRRPTLVVLSNKFISGSPVPLDFQTIENIISSANDWSPRISNIGLS